MAFTVNILFFLLHILLNIYFFYFICPKFKFLSLKYFPLHVLGYIMFLFIVYCLNPTIFSFPSIGIPKTEEPLGYIMLNTKELLVVFLLICISLSLLLEFITYVLKKKYSVLITTSILQKMTDTLKNTEVEMYVLCILFELSYVLMVISILLYIGIPHFSTQIYFNNIILMCYVCAGLSFIFTYFMYIYIRITSMFYLCRRY